jgi:hypothetical protein
MALQTGDDVRVIRLDQSGADHLVIHEAQRPPRLGDRGTIIEVRGEGDEARYLVEADDGDGEALWLAEFGADELQLESEFEQR